MANFKMCRSLAWVTFCTCVVFCIASPARRQFVSYNTETTSSDPSVIVPNDSETWDDSDDDFDLEDFTVKLDKIESVEGPIGGGWLKEVSAAPPVPVDFSMDYEDYDGDEDVGDVRQDTNESTDAKRRDSELLFLHPADNRLLLEDDDDEQSGLIKVRHSSKNSFQEPQENLVDPVESVAKGDSNGQFVFTIDDDNDDDDNINKVDKDDDFVIEDADQKTDGKSDITSRRQMRNDDDDDEDDEDDNPVEDENDNNMFDSPEDEAQVIYGDHVFLY